MATTTTTTTTTTPSMRIRSARRRAMGIPFALLLIALLCSRCSAWLPSPSSSGAAAAAASRTRSAAASPEPPDGDAALATDQETTLKQDPSLSSLCAARNLDLSGVRNARDLSSAPDSRVRPGLLFRTGRVGDASAEDQERLLKELGIKTLIDLRSPTELKEDETLWSAPIFQGFSNIVWSPGRRDNTKNLLRELKSGETPWSGATKEKGNVKKRKRSKGSNAEEPQGRLGRRKRRRLQGKDKSEATATEAQVEVEVQQQINGSVSVVEVGTEALDEIDIDVADLANNVTADEIIEIVSSNAGVVCDDDCDEGQLPADFVTQGAPVSVESRKERHFVSLMNEFKYVRGTVSQLRKRDLARALLKSPGAVVSKRMRESLKEPFLTKINDGGLVMLNQLLLRFGAPGIRYVLELCADKDRHPIAFYCTAGKDRTGMIAALVLSICGANPDSIVEDYSLSGNVYAEMDDNSAMVGALSQRNLDPETFLGAPPEVMENTLSQTIPNMYGSVEGYCDWIGFGPEQRQKLREALVESEDEDDKDA